jgi:hypothetical protein
LGVRATSRSHGLAAQHQAIAAFWNHMVNADDRLRRIACDRHTSK